MTAPATETPPSPSPTEQLMMKLPAAEQALHLIDNMLTEVSTRELVSAAEMMNFLLDLRIIVSGDKDGFPNFDPPQAD